MFLILIRFSIIIFGFGNNKYDFKTIPFLMLTFVYMCNMFVDSRTSEYYDNFP